MPRMGYDPYGSIVPTVGTVWRLREPAPRHEVDRRASPAAEAASRSSCHFEGLFRM